MTTISSVFNAVIPCSRSSFHHYSAEVAVFMFLIQSRLVFCTCDRERPVVILVKASENNATEVFRLFRLHNFSSAIGEIKISGIIA